MRASERKRILVANARRAFEVAQHRVERAVGMVGRALQTDLGMGLASNAGQHGLAEARFAEPRLAGQQKQLALSGNAHRPTVEHECQFGVTADERGGGWVAGGAEAAGVVMSGDHLPSWNALADALQSQRIYRFELEQIGDQRAGAGGDDHAVARSDGLQAGSEIGSFAEHGLLGSGAYGDRIPDHNHTAGDADTTTDFESLDRSKRGHRRSDVEPRAHGAFGIVLVRLRIAEIDENAIAHEFRYETIITGDAARDLMLIGVNQALQNFEVECGG